MKLDWRIPRVPLGDSEMQYAIDTSQGGGAGTTPVTPYKPPPVIVLPVPSQHAVQRMPVPVQSVEEIYIRPNVNVNYVPTPTPNRSAWDADTAIQRQRIVDAYQAEQNRAVVAELDRLRKEREAESARSEAAYRARIQREGAKAAQQIATHIPGAAKAVFTQLTPAGSAGFFFRKGVEAGESVRSAIDALKPYADAAKQIAVTEVINKIRSSMISNEEVEASKSAWGQFTASSAERILATAIQKSAQSQGFDSSSILGSRLKDIAAWVKKNYGPDVVSKYLAATDSTVMSTDRNEASDEMEKAARIKALTDSINRAVSAGSLRAIERLAGRDAAEAIRKELGTASAHTVVSHSEVSTTSNAADAAQAAARDAIASLTARRKEIQKQIKALGRQPDASPYEIEDLRRQDAQLAQSIQEYKGQLGERKASPVTPTPDFGPGAVSVPAQRRTYEAQSARPISYEVRREKTVGSSLARESIHTQPRAKIQPQSAQYITEEGSYGTASVSADETERALALADKYAYRVRIRHGKELPEGAPRQPQTLMSTPSAAVTPSADVSQVLLDSGWAKGTDRIWVMPGYAPPFGASYSFGKKENFYMSGGVLRYREPG